MIKPSWVKVRDWGGHDGAGSWEGSAPALEPIQNNFLNLDFCLHPRGGWRSRQTVSWSIFVALFECNGEQSHPKQGEKYLSVSGLLIHQIFFNFCLSPFNAKDIGEAWSQGSVLKSAISTPYKQNLLLPKAGLRHHMCCGAGGDPWPRVWGALLFMNGNLGSC